MTLSIDRGGVGRDMGPCKKSNDGPDIIAPILRSGILAREFCRHGAHAEVEAVFERSFYLRSGDMFVCVGEPAIGDGALTLIADLGALCPSTGLGLYPGQPASISDRCIAIGDLVQFTFDRCVAWRQPPWPRSRSPRELNDLGRVVARRMALESPPEGLGRVFCRSEGDTGGTALARIARPRIARFESWLLGALDRMPMKLNQDRAVDSVELPLPEGEREQTELAARPGHISPERALEADLPITALPTPVADLIGLGPGLTPSGDDVLVGALALLDALSERNAHAALARAVVGIPHGSTCALSECLLKAAAAGHLGAALCCAVSAVVSGAAEEAVAAIRKIGHSSGWDMMVGILTALRAVATRDANSRIGGSF
jgi:hypothetical protein